ncbi:hypothetical protein [Pseudoflavitalea rhizosphaerae]|uniref:hypothetical protein n=1 Tax=Pseudoflavitalea rhizosphaerae TaxID=1884793 RepID=UPI000F8C6D0B|nr:hypothetical protein [Pseudoflavitalea rhizosphaerae]
MAKSVFRPWGNLNWLTSKLSETQWCLYGCLSTEERCRAVFQSLVENKILARELFVEIKDPEETEEHEIRRTENKESLQQINQALEIESHFLLEPLNKIVDSITLFLKRSNGNIILDISCLPKRFFFPIIKFILREKELKNFIVCYTSPGTYPETNLSDNPQPWMPIPSFRSDDEDGTEVAIIGVGFMPLGLPDVLGSDGNRKKQVSLLFPFPPGPPYYQRTWNFVKEINEYRPIQAKELVRIDAKNISEVFDKICAISENGNKKVLFAPFGPKTFSLAMCLHACQSNSSVYYTQPMYYNPNYSEGYGETLGYSIVLNGQNLYSL